MHIVPLRRLKLSPQLIVQFSYIPQNNWFNLRKSVVPPLIKAGRSKETRHMYEISKEDYTESTGKLESYVTKTLKQNSSNYLYLQINKQDR